MSLFENSHYVYEDTLFVYFKHASRPTGAAVKSALSKLGRRVRVENLKETDGRFDSITLFSPQDCSAMDIVYVDGEEVKGQRNEILTDLKSVTMTGEDRNRLSQLSSADCRFDVFHFGEVTGTEDEEEGGNFDPGGLMLVLDILAELTQGISYDPQSQSLL